MVKVRNRKVVAITNQEGELVGVNIPPLVRGPGPTASLHAGPRQTQHELTMDVPEKFESREHFHAFHQSVRERLKELKLL